MLLELLVFVWFASKGLDHTVRLDVLLDHVVQTRQRLADGVENAMRALRHSPDHEEEERCDKRQNQCENPVEVEHHAQCRNKHDGAIYQLKAGPGDEEANGLSVGGHAVHQIASVGVIEVLEVQRVQLLEFVGYEAVEHVLAESLHHNLVDVAQQHMPQVAGNKYNQQGDQTCGDASGDALVDNNARNKWRDQSGNFIEGEKNEGNDQAPLVWLAILPNPSQIAVLLAYSRRLNIHRKPLNTFLFFLLFLSFHTVAPALSLPGMAFAPESRSPSTDRA